MTARRTHGFTLIELLVAMAIVAVIGVMAMTGLSEVIHQQTLARERAARWQAIQLAMRVIVQDLSQLQPRPTRDELGEAFIPSATMTSATIASSRVKPRARETSTRRIAVLRHGELAVELASQ